MNRIRIVCEVGKHRSCGSWHTDTANNRAALEAQVEHIREAYKGNIRTRIEWEQPEKEQGK